MWSCEPSWSDKVLSVKVNNCTGWAPLPVTSPVQLSEAHIETVHFSEDMCQHLSWKRLWGPSVCLSLLSALHCASVSVCNLFPYVCLYVHMSVCLCVSAKTYEWGLISDFDPLILHEGYPSVQILGFPNFILSIFFLPGCGDCFVKQKSFIEACSL